ncbi:MAG: 6-phosphogluconolactonase, partial [Muribaculaceae bacterium]|nr:6-phosphogluconolactonase [Muribaculaceae bacterium]
MKTNLSSQIKIDTVSRRYYEPQSDIDVAALTREEKIYTRIFETVPDGSDYLARHIVRVIKKNVETKGKCVIAFGVGANCAPVYTELVRLYEKGEVSFENVVVFNLAEFYPVTPDGPSTLRRLRNIILDKVNVKEENIHSFSTSVTREDIFH